MKAAFFHGPHDIRTGEMDDAEPGPGEVVLDINAVGICGSDLHNYLLGDVGGVVAADPLVLGHEAAGVVVALGPGMEGGLTVGQRVAIEPNIHCSHCERCDHGDHHLCLNQAFMGLAPDHGALRERMTHPAHLCIPVPDSINDSEAALLEPLGVAIHAARLANVQIGDDVVVLGCGAIGLLLVRMARLAGARHIYATDRYDWRLDMAANFGADQVFNIDQVDVIDAVLSATNGRGVDVAIEAAWVDETLEQCVQMSRYGGRVVIVGIPAKDEMHMTASKTRRKELNIIYSRRMNHVYDTAIDLTQSGKVDLKALASHHFSLDETSKAFETAGTYIDGVLRAMVIPSKSAHIT